MALIAEKRRFNGGCKANVRRDYHTSDGNNVNLARSFKHRRSESLQQDIEIIFSSPRTPYVDDRSLGDGRRRSHDQTKDEILEAGKPPSTEAKGLLLKAGGFLDVGAASSKVLIGTEHGKKSHLPELAFRFAEV